MDISPYDAIVVGSGATGGIAALTLAEQGLKVLVIEDGPKIKRLEASNYEPKSTFKRARTEERGLMPTRPPLLATPSATPSRTRPGRL